MGKGFHINVQCILIIVDMYVYSENKGKYVEIIQGKCIVLSFGGKNQ